MKNRIISGIICLALLLVGCEKDFLETKPNKALLIPKTLTEFNALLDNLNTMNRAPSLNTLAADDFYFNDVGWAGIPEYEKNSYLWDEVFGVASNSDWNVAYAQVFYANIVLDGLESYKDPKVKDLRQVKGAALFYRGLSFFNLAQNFTLPFNLKANNQNLGIPLRLTGDINLKSNRGTVANTYKRICADIEEAYSLLPLKVSHKSRPSKLAAAALLARIYLCMGNYDEAEKYADLVLQGSPQMIDYNKLPINNLLNSFEVSHTLGNSEVLFYSTQILYPHTKSALTLVSPEVHQSYVVNDLRKPLYFADRGDSIFNFKGNYTGTNAFFAGIALDEVFLIKSECLARRGRYEEGLLVLDSLLIKRWKTGTYQKLQATNADEALHVILFERRKTLIGRGLRWMDLRRLNQEFEFSVTVKKVIAGITYTLMPNSKRYAFPIPQSEIDLSGIQQNPRN